MKRVLIMLALAFVLMVGFVSAAHECSSGAIKEDKEEIAIYGIKNVNGLAVGLIKSDSSILERYSARVIVDADKFTLKNSSGFTDEVSLIDDEKTVKLLNLTSDIAGIKVDTHSGEIDLEDQETETIGSSKVFLTSFEGTYPDSAEVGGIIGSVLVSLDNENPSKIITLSDVEYVIELFSASDNEAIITVKKCEDEDASIVEIADPVPAADESANESANNSFDNSTTLNNTNESESLDETPSENHSEVDNLILNESSDESSDGGTALEGQSEKSLSMGGKILWASTITIAGLIIIILFILIPRLKKKKHPDSSKNL